MIRKELKRDFKIVSENGFFLVKRIYSNRERLFSKTITENAAISYLADYTGFSEQVVKSEMCS